MQQGLTAEIAAADADPLAYQSAPVAARPRRALLLAIGVIAYLVTLVATIPARFIVGLDSRWDVAGTMWRGEAVLDGAYRVEWRWAPLRSLASLGFAADWRMTGSGVDIAGSGIAGRHRLLLEGVSGRGSGALLAALVPGLPATCDAAMAIDLPRLLLAGGRSEAEGQVRTDAGTCVATGGTQAVIVPPLAALLANDRSGVTTATVAPLGLARRHLVEGTLAGGRLVVAATPAGAALVPFLRGFRVERSW